MVWVVRTTVCCGVVWFVMPARSYSCSIIVFNIVGVSVKNEVRFKLCSNLHMRLKQQMVDETNRSHANSTRAMQSQGMFRQSQQQV